MVWYICQILASPCEIYEKIKIKKHFIAVTKKLDKMYVVCATKYASARYLITGFMQIEICKYQSYLSVQMVIKVTKDKKVLYYLIETYVLYKTRNRE